jgi:hypothetical protein
LWNRSKIMKEATILHMRNSSNASFMILELFLKCGIVVSFMILELSRKCDIVAPFMITVLKS